MVRRTLLRHRVLGLHRAQQAGQAMTEYLVVAAATGFMVLLDLTRPDSLLLTVLYALGSFFRRFSFALSLPT